MEIPSNFAQFRNGLMAKKSSHTTKKADPSKAEKKLGWKAKHRMKDVVKMMIQAELTEKSGTEITGDQLGRQNQ